MNLNLSFIRFNDPNMFFLVHFNKLIIVSSEIKFKTLLNSHYCLNLNLKKHKTAGCCVLIPPLVHKT